MKVGAAARAGGEPATFVDADLPSLISQVQHGSKMPSQPFSWELRGGAPGWHVECCNIGSGCILPAAHHIFSCTVVAQTCFYLLPECTVTHWLHALAWLKSRSTSSAVRPKTFTPHSCRTLCRTWHHAQALLLSLFLNQSSSNLNNTSEINGHSRVAPWRKYRLLQVMSPTGLLNTGITDTSPQTVSSLNTRIYVSDPCLSTSRS